jgi:hypothetical protein
VLRITVRYIDYLLRKAAAEMIDPGAMTALS